MELIDARRIWDLAPHNAFTDVLHFGDWWYCAFREGQGHVCDDGKLRLIRSRDGEKWTSAALMAWQGGDVRDAKLSVTADAQLMLSGAVRFLKPVDGNRHQSLSWLSADGVTWTEPFACPSGLGTWRWSVTWHGGVGYSFGYSGKDEAGCLYGTRDGKIWDIVKDNVFPDAVSYPNETSIVFLEDGTGYCLLRRDKGTCGHGRACRAHLDQLLFFARRKDRDLLGDSHCVVSVYQRQYRYGSNGASRRSTRRHSTG